MNQSGEEAQLQSLLLWGRPLCCPPGPQMIVCGGATVVLVQALQDSVEVMWFADRPCSRLWGRAHSVLPSHSPRDKLGLGEEPVCGRQLG